MNKHKIIIFIIALILIICSIFALNVKRVNKFKIEYESLNGKKNEEGKTYKSISIKKNNPIEYANYEKIFDVLDNTGIIYFGFPECPWCRSAIPSLLDAAEETGLEKIYYMNNLNDRDIKVLKDGSIVTEKKGTNNYNKLLKKIGDMASTYEGLNDETIKRLYYPTVIAVKNGNILDIIVGTVDSQKDPYTPLTKKQALELKEKYTIAMNKILMCDASSSYTC